MPAGLTGVVDWIAAPVRWIGRSLGRKLMLVVLTTTLAALLITAVAMAAYELRAYDREWHDDLRTQAEILARASVPALAFDDERDAAETLALLKVRPGISAAALYRPDARVFASYLAEGADAAQLPELPELPQSDSFRIEGDEGVLFHPIVQNQELVGTIFLRARYTVHERLTDYLTILAGALAISLLAALLLSAWLQRAVSAPVRALTQASQRVMRTRDFSMRVQRRTDDELGSLVDTFNAMLAEVGGRSEALETSNRTLQHEMQERLAAEEALRAADRRKDEFLATLAHELRNPLAPLHNALRILSMPQLDAENARRAREMMERQLRQMVRLVDDLLDVSRITTGKLAVRRQPVELQAILRNAVEQAQPFIDARRHTLELAVPPQPVAILADAARLAQVFANLLHNAAKYTDLGGRIRLDARFVGGAEAAAGEVAELHGRGDGARFGDGCVIVSVSDNGIGIAPDAIPGIFDMFSQLDHSLERPQAGLGVGLTLARRLVELHGGSITADSDGPGTGTRVTVTLPLGTPQTAEAGAAASGPGVAAPRQPAASGLRVLLADDNVDFVTSFATLLHAEGHEVRVVHDGNAALALAPGFRPQVAILDIGLPGLNGYDLARRLRAQEATAATLLIAVTGWGQEKDRQLAREAGFDHHLVKPVEFERIEALLRTSV